MEKIYLHLSREAIETIIDTMAAKTASLESSNDYLRQAAQEAQALIEALKETEAITHE